MRIDRQKGGKETLDIHVYECITEMSEIGVDIINKYPTFNVLAMICPTSNVMTML